MANKKISELPAAAALDGSEQIPVVQGGVTVRTTVTEVDATIPPHPDLAAHDALGLATQSELDTALALSAPLASPTFTGITTAPEFSASGLTGAVAASRYVGGTASGAPTTGTFVIGDFVIDRTGKIWINTVAGTPGTWVVSGIGAYQLAGLYRGTGVLAETHSRRSTLSNNAALSTGRQSLVRIWLEAGTLVTNIGFVSATTALSVGTNQWFSLYDAALAKLAVTADDTSTAWAANTRKALAVAGGAYPITVSAYYHLGIMVAATTVPTLLGSSQNGQSVLNAVVPIDSLADTTNTGLTTPATAPATATGVAATSTPYAYIT